MPQTPTHNLAYLPAATDQDATGQEDHNASAFQASVAAVDVRDGGTGLILELTDGSRMRLDAALLWQSCPSAAGRRRRLDGRDVPPAGIAVTKVTPIGRYAVNIGFSDGHDRGIYPWQMLLELSRRPTTDDFIVPR